MSTILFCLEKRRLWLKTLLRLSSKFDLKVLGQTRKLLGVEFEYSNGSVQIHQSTYITEVYERFKSFKPPISSLLIVKGAKFSKSDCPTDNLT